MPVHISDEFYLISDAVEYPLNRARIGLHNIITTATVIDADFEEGFFPENLRDDNTYAMWRPDSVAGTVVYDFTADAAYEVDYIGIAAHSLAGSTFSLSSWNGSGWTAILTDVAVDTNDTIMAIFPKVFASRFKVEFDADELFSIGVMHIGKAFAFERPFFLGHRPLVLNRTTAIEHKITEKGLDIGRYIIKKGASAKVTVKNQTPNFIRNTFMPMIIEARTKGFFFAWRPDTYPNDIAFCWTRENVKPVNSGRLEYMDIDFTVKAI